MQPFQIDPQHACVVLPADAPHHEWLEERYNGIGGSDIAVAAGVSPSTPYQLWLTKTRRVDPELLLDDTDRERFRWGHKLEPVLLDAFAEDHPWLRVTPGAGTYARPDAKHHRVNVDGLAWTPDGQLDGVIEAKTANHRQTLLWDNDEVPIQYVAQCQWAMHITGAPRAYITVLIDSHDNRVRVIERDDDLINDLAAAADEFWRLVETDTPPPVDSSSTTRRMLAATHTEENAEVELDPEWSIDLRRQADLAERITELTAERDKITNRLRAAMGEAEVARLFGDIVATHKRPKTPQRRVCRDTLSVLRDINPTAYRQIVTETPASRRLHIK